ncbi:MAG TPA: hypothetical protein PLU80_19820, partial [Acidobacteriota bacterium]|nr:hypothetical protein [Acidobacteriota bacterium]
MRATSVEGTGEAVIGTGNPRNEPTAVTVTQPIENGRLIVSRSEPAGIQWTYVGPCDPSLFRIIFEPDDRGVGDPISFSVGGTARSIDEPLGDISDRFLDFVKDGRMVKGSLTIETMSGLDFAQNTVRGVTLVGDTPGGGGEVVIDNIQLRIQGSDCNGVNDNLALNDTVNISWNVGQSSQSIAGFNLRFNGVPIQTSASGSQTAATWVIPINDSRIITDSDGGTLSIEAVNQSGSILGRGLRFGIRVTPVAVNATSNLVTIAKGGSFSVSGCIRNRSGASVKFVRVSFQSSTSSSGTKLGMDEDIGLNLQFSGISRQIPANTASGRGSLIIEVLDSSSRQVGV